MRLVIEAAPAVAVAVAKRALTALWPAKLAELVVSLLIAQQVLELQLHTPCHHGDGQKFIPTREWDCLKTPEHRLSFEPVVLCGQTRNVSLRLGVEL